MFKYLLAVFCAVLKICVGITQDGAAPMPKKEQFRIVGTWETRENKHIEASNNVTIEALVKLIKTKILIGKKVVVF